MMDESDGDLAEGRLVALADVLADLDAALDRVKVKRSRRQT
jgi:hypothetical protein